MSPGMYVPVGKDIQRSFPRAESNLGSHVDGLCHITEQQGPILP